MDLFPIKFTATRSGATFALVLGLVGLVVNVLFVATYVYILAYAAAKGWSAA